MKKVTASSKDHDGRRSGVDRRHFSYSNHIPERRKGEERRAELDRRTGKDRRDKQNATSENSDMRVAEMDRRIALYVASTM